MGYQIYIKIYEEPIKEYIEKITQEIWFIHNDLLKYNEVMVYGSNFDDNSYTATELICNKLIENNILNFKITHSR